jgi:phosphonoacetaldehyde hydrolase
LLDASKSVLLSVVIVVSMGNSLSKLSRNLWPMNVARQIRLVVLDWAGTTVDFGCFAPVASFAMALERHGVSATDEQVRRPMGLAKLDHVRALLSIPELASQWQAAQGRVWDESDVERIYRDDYIPLQMEAVAGHDHLIPGLLPVVETLRSRGLKIATTTGYFREAARLVFDSATRQGYARDLDVLPDEVSTGRPAPWMIFRAMERLDVYPPSAVVKVGDTVADIEEGRNAGAWSVGVIASSSEVGLSESGWNALAEAERRAIISSVRARFERAGAHATIETLAELPGLIADLERNTQGSS